MVTTTPQHGIKETKEVLELGLSIVTIIDSQLEDGFQFTDLFNIIPVLTTYPNAIDGIDKVPHELADLDDDERRELVKVVSERLDVRDDKAEQIARRALRLGLEIAHLALFIRAMKANK